MATLINASKNSLTTSELFLLSLCPEMYLYTEEVSILICSLTCTEFIFLYSSLDGKSTVNPSLPPLGKTIFAKADFASLRTMSLSRTVFS